MTDSCFELMPRAAFTGLHIIPASLGGVVVRERDGLAIAAVLVRRGQQGALRRLVCEHFGIELPLGPQRVSAGNCAFIGTGPGAWYATSESAGHAFVTALAQVLGEYASISDQSDGQAVLRVSGRDVRETLCRLVPIDLHPRAFRCGDVAVTMAAHIGTTLWRLDDDGHGHAVFELAVYRSLAESFWTALSQSAAEFGFKWEGPGPSG